MTKALDLSKNLTNAGWHVHIYRDESREPPHVTIWRRKDAWRWDLRERRFRDREPDPRLVPDEILKELDANYDKLCKQWDEYFPKNKVHGD